MSTFDLNIENQSLKLQDSEILNLQDFWIKVTAVNNTTDIRGVVLKEECIKKRKQIAKEMKIHYNNEDSVLDSVITGNYYAVFEYQIWQRVRCLDSNFESKSATVLFIDRGDHGVYPFDSLYHLNSKFYSLPAQSLKLSIAGLEVFYDCKEIEKFLKNLLMEKEVYVKVLSSETSKDITTLLAALIFQEETEISCANEILIEEILKTIANPNIYLKSDETKEAYISHVNNENIFMQIKSKGLVCFKRLMKDFNEKMSCCEYQKASMFDCTKVYITKNKFNSEWNRVKIIDIGRENMFVMFIDIGIKDVIRKEDLILLEDLSVLLSRYPNQAIEIKLHKISPFMFNENMASYLHKISQQHECLYLEVIAHVENIPVVQFHKLTKFNSCISLNDDLNLKSKLIMYLFSSKPQFPLKAPNLPVEDSYFDVYVSMAGHPDNFTVQSLNSFGKLRVLMSELLNFCESFSGPHLTSNSIKVGGVYAVQDIDDTWYRGCIYKTINSTTFAVYNCDYGNYSIVSLSNLQPLDQYFWNLPYQAIKAKLFGVNQQQKNNWTVADSLKFNQLVASKTLVANIKGRELDESVLNGYVLCIELIDTTSDDDIYIADIVNGQ